MQPLTKMCDFVVMVMDAYTNRLIPAATDAILRMWTDAKMSASAHHCKDLAVCGAMEPVALLVAASYAS